ncbi:long-chain-fatty-acid--CoA ligase [Arthrobacter roseus]|uniref:long-chain-fatty-acid--CoA ligase n=1 Tax=Arthrobacter roseus TaxID=136274 RepID=UPI00196540A6|nr:long-chain fatty acid--CoA ligase [Arthrobacter roseus]MBM7847265.1 long-chain acyl-CoA synthetase [Arthrobacter roseus]
MPNLATNLVSTAAKYPETVAIKLDDVELSYAALEQMSQRVSTVLGQKGVKPGDRVALIMPNIPQMAFIYYGVLRYGAVVVPMNPLLKAREVAYHLTDSGARVVFAWDGVAAEVLSGAETSSADQGGPIEVITVDGGTFMQQLMQAAPRPEVAEAADDDVAVLLYTSGTTGRPKGAALTHANLISNASVSGQLIGIDAGEVIFGGLPFFHVFGQTCALNAAVATGATVTLMPRFDPAKALEVIKRDAVTIFAGVPTMYIAMLRHPSIKSADVSSLKTAVSGGSALPVEILREFEEVFGADLLEGYGLSETSPVVSFNRKDRERQPGSIGTPVQGVEVRMLDGDGNDVATGDVGELSVRGECVMKGYWNNDDATAAAIPDGWFRTGDLARFDEAGNIFIVDRKKDMILRGGYNVYPREVEEVLYSHPAVAEAAVIGVPDDMQGEEIVAVVGLKPEYRPDSDSATETLLQEIQDFAKERVAAYKYPRRIVLTDELPKGPTGKILKREIIL